MARPELPAVDLLARGPHGHRDGRAEVADVRGKEPPPAGEHGFLRRHLRPRRHRLLEDEDVVLAGGGLGHDAEARRPVAELAAGKRQRHEAEALVEAADARGEEVEPRPVPPLDRPRAVVGAARRVERGDRAAVEVQLEAVRRRTAVQADVNDVGDRLVRRAGRGGLALPLDRPRRVDGAAQQRHREAGVAPAVAELSPLHAAHPALSPAAGEERRGGVRRRHGSRKGGRERREDDRAAHGHSSSRWTVSGEKAGRHTATYSAPPSSGVL